jgi:hypothetical protein
VSLGVSTGDVFWHKDIGDPHAVEHRVVVCSDPSLAPDQVITVPFTTWEEGKDESCYVTPQEYPALHHASCIDYRHAKIFTASELAKGVASGLTRQCPPVSSDVLKKIWDGATHTKFLAPRFLNILTAQGLLDS